MLEVVKNLVAAATYRFIQDRHTGRYLESKKANKPRTSYNIYLIAEALGIKINCGWALD
jgi:hypothetical protein